MGTLYWLYKHKRRDTLKQMFAYFKGYIPIDPQQPQIAPTRDGRQILIEIALNMSNVSAYYVATPVDIAIICDGKLYVITDFDKQTRQRIAPNERLREALAAEALTNSNFLGDPV